MEVRKDGSTVLTSQTTSDSSGFYKLQPFQVSEGNYTIIARQVGTPYQTFGFFSVLPKKILYTVSTDKFIYQRYENVTISVIAKDENGNLATATTNLKIKLKNGTVVLETTLQINGIATYVYNVTNYGEYVVVVGNGLAIAKFEVPPFEVKLDTLSAEGKSKSLFSSSESLKVQAIVRVRSGEDYIPVKGASISASIKDQAGNVKVNIPSANFSETSDGVYQSSPVSLSGLSGKYYVEVRVTKGSTTREKEIEFKVQNYRLDVIPFSKFENVFGFLKGSEGKLGLIIQDLKTGTEITQDKVKKAEIVECRNEEWKPCSIPSHNLLPAMKDFVRVINFTAPSMNGQYYLKVRVTIATEKGDVNVSGDTWISVQDALAFVETVDEVGAWRWRYAPGETVVLRIKVLGENWNDISQEISKIEIIEVRDDNWNDVTSYFSSEIEGNEIKLTWNGETTQPSGWYSVKLKITMKDNTIVYAGAGFRVALYDVWAEVKDAYGNWQWRFESDSDVFLHVNVRKLSGSFLPADKIAKISVLKLRNEITGKVYTNLKVTDNGTAKNWAGEDVPVVKLSLKGMGLPTGFYSVEFEITDIEGNKERGGTGFKISNLDVQITTKRRDEWAWQFSPTDNITFEVNVRYLNGTLVPDGSNVTVEKLFLMRDGPPISIPSDSYSTSPLTQTQNGIAKAWLKAKQTLPEGFYMVMIRVVANESLPQPKQELAEGWFEIRSMRIELSTDQWAFSRDKNVTIHVIVRRADNTPLQGANVSLAGLRSAATWQDIDLEEVGINESCKIKGITDESGKFDLTFPANKLEIGEYEARVSVYSDSLKSSSEGFIWFSIRDYVVSGWFIVEPGREWGVYAPDEQVKMHIEVYYPNGSYASGETISVYQLVNTETWPWSFKNVTTISSVQVSPGVYEVTFKAPRESGWYNPLLNISGSISKSPWDLPSFQVRDLKVELALYNSMGEESEEFKPSEDVTINIAIRNPLGGSLPNITQIKIEKYRNLWTGNITPIGARKTTNIEESNNLTFQAPAQEGEYILVVSVSTPNRTIFSEKWFEVSPFSFEIWTDRWSYKKGENVSISIKAKYPDGSDATINVSAIKLRNVFTGSEPSISKETLEISGYGIYNFSTSGLESGEYELELCLFIGDSCEENSKRAYVHFAIESNFFVDAWPEKGGFFSTDENAIFHLRVVDSYWNPISPNDYTVTLHKLKNVISGSDLTSLIENYISFEKDTQANETIIEFPLANLTSGEYELMLNVTKDGESVIWSLWFRISDFKISIEITNPEQDPWMPYPIKENITFNISVIGSPPANNGTLFIKDNFKEWADAITPIDFELSNKQALVNVSLNEVSEYTAVVRIGETEEHRWFRTGAFFIDIDHHKSTHDIKPGDNVTIYFTIKNSTGDEYIGPVKIYVTEIKDARTWNSVDFTPYETSVDAAEGEESFSFNASQSSGEYEAEIIFSIDVGGGKWVNQSEYFWFQYRTLDFWAWPDKPYYLPGEKVIIYVSLREPGGGGLGNRNISIVKVVSRTKGELPQKDWSGNWSITDTEGYAALELNISPSITGWIDVELNESETSQRTWAGFNINGYNVNFERDWSKWAFGLNENYTADLWVFFANGTPASGRSVRVLAYKEGKDPEVDSPDLNETMPNTDATGYTKIQFNCSNLTGGTGRYLVAILIDNKAAKVDDWIKVESFHVDAWVEGMETGRDEVRPGEKIRINVRVTDISGNPIQGANVSLWRIHKLPEWDWILNEIQDYNVTIRNGTTDSLGFVELGIIAPMNESEYLIELNVSHASYGKNIGEAWFRVTSSLVTWKFMCWNGTNATTCPGNPYEKFPGDTIALVVKSIGSIQVVPFEFKDLWRDRKILIGNQSFSEDNETVVPITIPEDFEEGDYELGFYVYVDDKFKGEYRAWFRVLSSTGYIFDRWVEPHNAWAGMNASIWIDVKNVTNWERVICEIPKDSKPIVEIRNAWTWDLVATRDQVTQWVSEAQEGPGPQGTRIIFVVPSNAVPGAEYLAILNFTCSNIPGVPFYGEAHFRVAAFEVSSLMPMFVEPNSTVNYWFKITDVNGTPVVNATVCQDELVMEPGRIVIDSWPGCSVSYNTTSQGEILGSIQAPGIPGDYMLRLTVINGTVKQKIERWFRIKSIKSDIIFEKEWYYNDEDVKFNVTVKDGLTDQPIPNAYVRVEVIEDRPEEGVEPIVLEKFTESDGIAQFVISNKSTTSNVYRVFAMIDAGEKGFDKLEKVFSVRNFNVTVSGISPEYQQGDTVTVKMHVENITNHPIENAMINAMLIRSTFGPPEEGEKEMIVSTQVVNTFTNSTGDAEFNLTINDTHSGMTIALIAINKTIDGVDKVDEVSYVFVTHKPGLSISVDIPECPFSPNEFIDANVSVTGSGSQLAIAPPLPTMEKVGESIPESQMMSMGKEIPFMESPIFLNQTGFAHMKLLAPSKTGKYVTLVMFIQRNSDWFGPEDMYDVTFVEYEVK